MLWLYLAAAANIGLYLYLIWAAKGQRVGDDDDDIRQYGGW